MEQGIVSQKTSANSRSHLIPAMFGSEADVLRFQYERIVKNLFKSFLIILEDLQREHDDAIYKLRETLPSEYRNYANLIDHWSNTKADFLRKRILDMGNDTIRELTEQLNNYDVTIKNGKGTIL